MRLGWGGGGSGSVCVWWRNEIGKSVQFVSVCVCMWMRLGKSLSVYVGWVGGG